MSQAGEIITVNDNCMFCIMNGWLYFSFKTANSGEEEKPTGSAMLHGVSGKAGVVTNFAVRARSSGVNALQLSHLNYLWAVRGPTQTKRPRPR